MHKSTQYNYFLMNRKTTKDKGTNYNAKFSKNKQTTNTNNASSQTMILGLGLNLEQKKNKHVSTQCNTYQQPELKGKINKIVETDLKITRPSRDYACQTNFEYSLRNVKLNQAELHKFPVAVLQTLDKPIYDGVSFEVCKISLIRPTYIVNSSSFSELIIGKKACSWRARNINCSTTVRIN